MTVQAFAEEGGAARIPGPLLRTVTGREVEVSLRNSLDSTLVVHGMRGGDMATDTLQLSPRTTRVVRFRAGAPGRYLYWGSTTNAAAIGDRTWRDSQLTGAIVVDAAGVRPDPAERIFVMTVIDIVPSDTLRNRAKEDVWELAINGRSWPHSERLRYTVGETVRWTWLNGTYLPHPMHLHGFHFRVLAKGEGNRDSTYAPAARRMAVTELMMPGGTFRMDWVPTRAGSWLFHCHMIPHVRPFPDRPDSVKSHHGANEGEQHALTAMAGLVLGITTVDGRPGRRLAATPTRHLRLLAQQSPADSGKPARRGYVLQSGASPKADSVSVPGTPLILTRGQTTAITVVNRMREATTVHWHGMELESVYDGVPGWSRTGAKVAPLLASGDSFTVTMTPPRAGTFIYHTHMDEGAQLGTGMYGAMLVMEPGERHDPATDLTFILGSAVVRDSLKTTLNGRRDPAPIMLRAGTRYRLRFINILAADGAQASLLVDSLPVTWRARAKDGADLPPPARIESAATLKRLGTGETYDFEWTPLRPMQAELQFRLGRVVLRQPLEVR